MAPAEILAVSAFLKLHNGRSSLLYGSAWKTPCAPRPILYASGCSRRSTPSYGYLVPPALFLLSGTMTLSKGRCVRDPLRQHWVEDESMVQVIQFKTGDRTQAGRAHPTTQVSKLHGVG